MATNMTPCIGNDPGCPCQDGLACHYVDLPGSPAWPVPRHEPSGDHPPEQEPRMTEFVTPPPATHPPFPADAWRPTLPNRPARVAELEQRVAFLEAMLDAMTAQRDHALLRMEVAVAISHAWIDAEVRRRFAEAGRLPAFPANALRQQSQPIGLLSTADAGRVRLGGYAPSLPPR